jgi:hypothetical protein
MFKKTSKNIQLNLFSNVPNFLSGTSLKIYSNDFGWHNLFRETITNKIDEELFRPLFCSDNGAPNASIRILIAMMVLKEARGLSDEQLYEECRFNLLVRSALGLLNVDDPLPTNSTYYLLRKRIVSWEKSGHENLIEKVFSQITKSQVLEFNINGKRIRMDSKLLGSNIAWYSRYELIHECLRKFYPEIKSDINRFFLNDSDIELLDCISGESGDKVSYRSNKTEIETRLVSLGKIIYKLICQIEDHLSESFQTLCRVFEEQYTVNEDNIVIARPKETISAKSVQSPYDTDCHYRNKDGNEIKGYSVNVTETCTEDNPINLITNVLVDVSSTADCDFLQVSTDASEEVLLQQTECINADGAYHSVDNQDYCKLKGIDLIIGAIQGKQSRYDLSLDENGILIVTDLQTNIILPSIEILSGKNKDITKWKIKTENGRTRYFTHKDIDTCLLRKEIALRPQKELNIRNNVEATIFQLGYHYSNDKSRYRGLIKHKMWANLRCLWINFVRIMNFILNNRVTSAQILKELSGFQQIMLSFQQIMPVFIEILFFGINHKIFNPKFLKNKYLTTNF